MWKTLGYCGTQSVLLPIMIGEPVGVCPVVTATETVRFMAEMLPGPGEFPGLVRKGLLHGVPDYVLPLKWREWREIADLWLKAWTVKEQEKAVANA